MIVDRVQNLYLYQPLHPRIRAAFEYLRNSDLMGMPAGKYVVDGLNIYAMLQEYQTREKKAGKWEAHRNYIDLQAVLQGEEFIGYANIAAMKQGAYDTTKDTLSLTGEGDFIQLREGSFALLFPEDAHMPGIAVHNPTAVKKVVVKIAVY